MVVEVNLSIGELAARVAAVTAGIDDLSPARDKLDSHIAAMFAPWRPRPWPDLTRRILTVDCDAVVTCRKSVVLQRITPLGAAAVPHCVNPMQYVAPANTDCDCCSTPTGKPVEVNRCIPAITATSACSRHSTNHGDACA